MAIRKYLARDHRFFISTDNRATWVPISGISEWTFTVDSNSEDVSTMDYGAWGSSIHTQRTATLSLTGFYLSDATTGARDAGQLAWEQASMKVGYAATRDFKVEAYAGGSVIGHIIVTGTPSIADLGGATTAVLPWGGEVAVDGAPTGSGMYNIFV